MLGYLSARAFYESWFLLLSGLLTENFVIEFCIVIFVKFINF
jgi:hypothetical protein